jgi:uncharacterized protein YcbX
MELSGLYVYPIKSAAPLALDAATVEVRGLAQDRRWMVVDATGRFLSGRELPRLTLVRAQPVARGLELSAPGMPALHVATPVEASTLAVIVWDDTVVARLASRAVHDWLSAFLGQPVQLVHMDASAYRAVDPDYGRPGDEVSFADGFPLLLVTQAAGDALNARLAHPVPILRFRPNLVVSGAAAHAEDGWKRVRIGAVEFDVVKPCTRCLFTTVDFERGERDPSGEPLRTLIGYRRGERGVSFGQNLIPRSSGVVRVGDAVSVLA